MKVNLSPVKPIINKNNSNSIVFAPKTQNRTQICSKEAAKGIYAVSFAQLNPNRRHRQEKFDGCLVGGAVGDAFGARVEAYSLDRIKTVYGENGLRYIPKSHGEYKITDDTQMTLFTAEGLLKSYLRNPNLKLEPNYSDIYDSYQNWYLTQTKDFEAVKDKKGLLDDKRLYSKRGPGYTCMTALKSGKIGTEHNKVNNSAGNGGVMRIAPIGLLYNKNPKLAFEIGMKSTMLTHGHPSAYLPAGFHASLIAQLVNDKPLEEAIENSIKILKTYKNHEETLYNIEKAITLAKSDTDSLEAINSIGKGGKGDEAVAIALYCVLKNPNNFKKALTMAVNHSGDSDTIASITGNILGANLGIKSIPRGWFENVEMLNWILLCSKSLNVTTPNNKAIVPLCNSDDKFI